MQIILQIIETDSECNVATMTPQRLVSKRKREKNPKIKITICKLKTPKRIRETYEGLRRMLQNPN